MKLLGFFACALAWLAAFLCAIWAIGALYFDFPTAGLFAAIVFVITLLLSVIFVRGKTAETWDRLWRICSCGFVVAHLEAQ